VKLQLSLWDQRRRTHIRYVIQQSRSGRELVQRAEASDWSLYGELELWLLRTRQRRKRGRSNREDGPQPALVRWHT